MVFNLYINGTTLFPFKESCCLCWNMKLYGIHSPCCIVFYYISDLRYIALIYKVSVCYVHLQIFFAHCGGHYDAPPGFPFRNVNFSHRGWECCQKVALAIGPLLGCFV